MRSLNKTFSLLAVLILVVLSNTNLNAQSQTFSPPCTPDCIDNWVTPITRTFNIPGCDSTNSCNITVTWTYRDACNSAYQDIQILGIQIGAGCFDNCSPKDIYQAALVAAMNHTIAITSWEPKVSPDCETTWRVATSACWKIEDHSQYDPITGELWQVAILMMPCAGVNGCCLQSMEVCRLASGALRITSTPGGSATGNCPTVEPDANPQHLLNCRMICEWNLLTGDFVPGNILANKETIYNSDSYFGLGIVMGQEIVNIRLENNKYNNLEIKLVDMSGRLIKEYNQALKIGANNTDITLGNLQTGTYLLLFNFDGKQLKSKKFNIIR